MVVHLLAPNHRPVQVTTDLAGILGAPVSASAARIFAALSQTQVAGESRLSAQQTTHVHSPRSS